MPFAGIAWQMLHYLEGLKRLGHTVFYLEDTQRWPYDPAHETVCDDAGPAVAYVAALMSRCGLLDSWAYRDVAQDGHLYGVSERRLAEVLAGADVLINLAGMTVLRDEHLDIPVRVYLETDPVLPQIEIAQGRESTIEFLSAHTHHFTYGENFGATDCQVPISRFNYRPTRPPVILDWWARPQPQTADISSRAFTTVANWRQTSKDIVYKGRTLTWSKDVQFMRFLPLPSKVDTPLELTLAIEDQLTVARLREAGWRVRPAGPVSKDLDAYRDYIRSSAGEFSVAKEQYASLRSGWFSDRTATYLAAGRPAIVHDTGFGCALPTGEGLFAFESVEDAVTAFETVMADYPRHARAAYRIAEEHLRAESVLARLLSEAASAP